MTHSCSRSNGKIDSRNGYYSPMHGNGVKKDRFSVTKSSPAPFLDSLELGGSGGTDMNEYYRPDSELDTLDPLLSSSGQRNSYNNQLTVGSYVQPGYIYVCDVTSNGH